MAIGSVLSSGLAGIQHGRNTVAKAADQIAKLNDSSQPSEDITRSAVDLQQGKIQVQASAKVIAAHSDMMGTLIDIEV